jgi:hypothetical protein
MEAAGALLGGLRLCAVLVRCFLLALTEEPCGFETLKGAESWIEENARTWISSTRHRL